MRVSAEGVWRATRTPDGPATQHLSQRDGATARDNRLWMHVAWAAMALAVLTKGLIGIVLPGIALVLYTLLERDWTKLVIERA